MTNSIVPTSSAASPAISAATPAGNMYSMELPNQDGEQGLDLRGLIGILWANFPLIAGVSILTAVIAAMVVLQLPQQYTASTSLMLETRQSKVLDSENVVSGLVVDNAVVQSEIAVLKSREIGYTVVEQLNLQNDPEFNPVVAAKQARLAQGLAEGERTVIDQIKQAVGLGGEVKQDYPLSRVVNNVLQQLRVLNDGQSYAITVQFSANNPEKAAKIANAWVSAYLQAQLDAKIQRTKEANRWLTAQLEQLKGVVSQADQQVLSARERSGLVNSGSDSIAGQQLMELNSQLTMARSERAEAEARLRSAQQLAGRGSASVTAVQSSPLIQRLREQETTLRRKEAELSGKYGPRHPTMRNLKAEKRDLQVKIQEEVNRIISGLRNEVQVSRARESSIRSQLSQLKAEVTSLNRSQMKIDQLAEEANVNREVYETFLARSQEIFSQDGLQTPDARLIARADPPQFASAPKRSLMVALAMLAGGLLATAGVFIAEFLNNSFRSSQQLATATGMQNLAMLPRIPKQHRDNLPAFLEADPDSIYAESVRTMLTTLQLQEQLQDNTSKTILVTSSIPGEGKSVLAASTAMLAAESGRRVIIIDADFRRPTLATVTKQPVQHRLADYLHGKCSLQDVLHKTETNLTYCLMNGHERQPQLLLESALWQKFLAAMQQQYDYVIIDSPPILAVADAQLLAPKVDHVLYAVKHSSTGVRVVRNALQILLKGLPRDKQPVISSVLTQVETKKHARYGYGDRGHYYGKYGAYYNNA